MRMTEPGAAGCPMDRVRSNRGRVWALGRRSRTACGSASANDATGPDVSAAVGVKTSRVRTMLAMMVKFIICLVVGAIVNVLVAWACALYAPHPIYNSKLHWGISGTWVGDTPKGWLPQTTQYAARNFGRTEMQIYGRVHGSLATAAQFVSAAGFPLRSLHHEVHGRNARTRQELLTIPASWREGLLIPAKLSWLDPAAPPASGIVPSTRLPTRLMWPGT